MSEETKNCAIHSTQSLAGAIWVIGWWFTIDFAKLVWWKAILAVIFWGYYLGAALRP